MLFGFSTDNKRNQGSTDRPALVRESPITFVCGVTYILYFSERTHLSNIRETHYFHCNINGCKRPYQDAIRNGNEVSASPGTYLQIATSGSLSQPDLPNPKPRVAANS